MEISMKEYKGISFYSKRNQVYPALREDRPVVEKHFAEMEDWARETSLYEKLAGRISIVPKVYTEPGLLVTEYVHLPTLLDILETQERMGFSIEPWRTLASWIRQCRDVSGMLPSDGNLRNFLWDASQMRVIGLDMEGYQHFAPEQCGALIAAAVLAYDPAETLVKRQVANVLAKELGISTAELTEARLRLEAFRLGKTLTPMSPAPSSMGGHNGMCQREMLTPMDVPAQSMNSRTGLPQRKMRIPMSGVILAGGASRRMGASKAELELEGKTLLDWQVDKLRALGIEDIMLSGKNCRPISGTRVIPDQYPDRGPLGGLYSCFHAARHSYCLVLSVDTPLIPAAALAKLCRMRTEGGIACLRHLGKAEPQAGAACFSHSEKTGSGTDISHHRPLGKIEPLIGVYDTGIKTLIEPLIKERGAAVRRLLDSLPCMYFDYLGPEEYLLNCNTPEDFMRVRQLAANLARHGIKL